MYGMRIMVAVEPLLIISDKTARRKEYTYIAPRARINATDILVLGLSFKSQTRNIGRIANVQSAKALSALCVYVEPVTIPAVIHLPLPQPGCIASYCLQKYARGRH